MPIEGRLVETGQPVRVVTEGARIARIEALEDAPPRWIAPGLIDLQVNGFAGHDANAAGVTPETIARMVRALWRGGVTTVYPTLITESEARLCAGLRAIAAARESDPLVAHAIPGIHVEGPSISPEDGPRGAHPLEQVRPPSLEEYRRWQEAARGLVGIITLAPEHAGADEYIAAVAGDGVVVALGHTAADEGQIRAAVNAGARLSTHLGNGAHARIARHPNYIWSQLSEDRLFASLIFDGHHLPPAVMKAMLRAKGVERTILVSDAVAAAGLPPGIYEAAVGGKVELLPSGRLNLAGTPYLAGSASALTDGVANAMRYAGTNLADAVRLATANPARLMGLDGPAGRGAVRVGKTADLTVFQLDPLTQELRIEQTLVSGEVVYQREET